MQNIYIIGPSCGGKTSTLHFLKTHGGEKINIPIRVVSRNSRGVNDAIENRFLKKDDFVKKRQTPEFFISWHRIFEKGRKEYYGFLRENVSNKKINIFSANNALLLYPESILPADVLAEHKSYFIVCTAPENVRFKRIKERSPEYGDEEIKVRIYKESAEKYFNKADMIIDTSRETIEENGNKLLSFIKSTIV